MMLICVLTNVNSLHTPDHNNNVIVAMHSQVQITIQVKLIIISHAP